ncbi:uncharacterized protein LOC142978568 [Anticarsia gemmatalis]|uniref:uncharacterized protein LOC142978568 n=1 Tax=Anticarsia gemmatalis TaxID=129554 RepID=UPI003F767FDB
MNCLRLLQLAERQSFNVFQISARCSSHYRLRFLETQNMWRENDNISKRWQLIYKAPMSTALNVASTYLTATTGLLSVGAVYYGAFVYDSTSLDQPVILGDDVVIANSPTECFIYIGAFIALHVAIKIVLSKYVVRLYQDGDEYLAVYRGHLFNSIKKHKFHLNEFQKLKGSVIIPWSDSKYALGKKQGILLENYFKTPEYLNYLITKKSKDTQDDDE